MTLAQTTPSIVAGTPPDFVAGVNPNATAATTATPPAASTPATTVAKGAYVPEPTHEIPEVVDARLVTILSWPRAHNSYTELQFCKWVREMISGFGATPVIRSEGCISVTVPRPAAGAGKPGISTTLFSCHMDTVDGSVSLTAGQPDRKKLVYDPIFGHITLDKDSIGGCLGADDGAGVWLMLSMIERKVPGTYLFHRGEECGGIGSKAMALKEKEWLGQFECAVAFDRAGTSEVITHQRGRTKCASAKFGEALAARLTAKGMSYRTSDAGSYTDTYEYRRIIPECVNLAVGYESQHGRREQLDYAHLTALLDALCAIDWDSLPIDRDQNEPDPVQQWAGSRGWVGNTAQHPHGQGGLFGADDDDWAPRSTTKKVSPSPTAPKRRHVSDSMRSMDYAELLSYIETEDVDTVIDGIVELRLALARAEAERDEYKLIGGFDL